MDRRYNYIPLIALAIWLICFEDEEGKLGRNLVGWSLIFTALSIILDQMAVGFSIGLIDIPIALLLV